MSNEKCTIGNKDGDKCHKNDFSKKEVLYKAEDLMPDELKLIEWRSGISIKSVCMHHKLKFLQRYEKNQKFCCDPYKRHKKLISKDTRPISMDLAKELDLIPGQRICKNCRVDMKRLKEESEMKVDEDCDKGYTDEQLTKESLNTSLGALGCSPIKYISSRDKPGYGKRKFEDVCTSVKERLQEVFDIKIETKEEVNCCQKSADLDKLLYLIKEKVAEAKNDEKVKLLTLVPDSWTLMEVEDFFNVSNRMARKAKSLREEKGILPLMEKKKGKVLSEEIKQSVLNFYESDEFSRWCPGKKEFVSVRIDGVKQHKQKRLLLINLKELHLQFKNSTNIEIGFSKFCELRPKWCTSVGSASGAHSVCVCEYHQNAKLMVAVIPKVCEYKELVKLLVCNIENRDCMLHSCEACPSTNILKDFLTSLFDENEVENVKFKQWIKEEGGRTNLVSLEMSTEEFIEEICRHMENMREHHFVAKAQSKFLNSVKENLKRDEVLVLLDFAENYSFLVQDAVQGYHWNNSQSTLHPFVIYFFEGEDLVSDSYCVISDEMKHDANAVHKFLSDLLTEIKSKLPNLKKCYYFSDGAASQYKNYKNFINLCHHKSDHGLDAEWHFFATSHGKSPCDGIGGTVKRLVARASLQKVSGDTIASPLSMFEWCSRNISGIKFLYVSSVEVKQHCSEINLETRYQSAKTVPGSRSFHSFTPSNTNKLILKRISMDITHSTFEFVNFKTKFNIKDIAPGHYYACQYDSDWYIGVVIQISMENQDVYFKFMKKSLINSFLWPARSDFCWIPINQILIKLESLTAQGNAARNYKLSDAEFTNIITSVKTQSL